MCPNKQGQLSEQVARFQDVNVDWDGMLNGLGEEGLLGPPMTQYLKSILGMFMLQTCEGILLALLLPKRGQI